MTTPILTNNGIILVIDRCPHCGVASPYMSHQHMSDTAGPSGERTWRVFLCGACRSLVTAESKRTTLDVLEVFPSGDVELPDSIPERPRTLLLQARESLAQPSGAIMLAASAIDAMFKEMGLKEGDLYPRIEQAAKDHLITEDMAKWAHQIRLDANDERHADEDASLPTTEDAKLSVDFAFALVEILFVLPARVTRGIKASSEESGEDAE